jgi:hypothetical protein
MESERVKKTLSVMELASTWYHDDLLGEFTGFSYYSRKRYVDALHYFEIGAYYADKPSQISMGLMHLRGEGTKADPVAALAWLDIAAKRGYPAYVATRDRVKATLSPEQQKQAAILREQLAAKYGDSVAKPRLANELREGRRRMTGSRAGFDNVITFLSPDALAQPHEAGSLSVGAVGVCAKGFWDSECWEPDQYFAMRDRQLNATVEVGPPQQEDR